MMPSARRLRFLLLTAILAILVLIYLITGARQTRQSDFYTRTVSLMEAKARGFAGDVSSHYAALPEMRRSDAKNADDQVGDERLPNPRPLARMGAPRPDSQAQKALRDAEETLKDRLQEAEKVAKKSADDKYRALKDVEAEIAKDRESRLLDGESVHEGHSRPKAQRPLADEDTRTFRKPSLDTESNNDGATKKASNPELDDDDQGIVDPARNKDKEAKVEDPEVVESRSILAEILARSPVTIFSKSYCPHSAKAKHILLNAFDIRPAPYIVELNHHTSGPALQDLLMKTTGRRTVPNILVNGKSVGGGDEMELLWRSGELPARVRQMGGRRVESVKEKIAWGKDPPKGKAGKAAT